MSAPRSLTRVALGLRAALAAGLAVGAAVLAIDLSDWRYVRLDLTARRSNTLDPAVLDVLDRLPEPVVIDAFLRPLLYPYREIQAEAADRALELLTIVRNARRSQVEVREHDPKDFEAIQERQRELGTEGTNKLVFSCGERRAELELFGELAMIDWGNPSERSVGYLVGEGIPGVVDPRTWQPGRPFRPARLLDFHGEELLAEALLKVASGTAPKVCFLKGHGEPALDGTSEPTDLGRLRAALERDGFAVAEWDPLKQPAVPGDCAVLALIGAKQPYQASTRETIEAWAEAGGCLIAAPDISELYTNLSGGIVELLSSLGIVTRPGNVCQPLRDFAGQNVDGSEQCAWLVIDERGLQPGHPLTEPLRARGRRVQFTLSASFESGLSADSGVVLPLVTSASDSWRDLGPDFDFRFNPARGEERERSTLIAIKLLAAAKSADGSVRQGRILAVASAFFFDNQLLDVNRDFALNAFNWLAEREYKISVKPLEKSRSFLDFERSRVKPTLTYVLWLGLPGACAAVGLLVFLRRRS